MPIRQLPLHPVSEGDTWYFEFILFNKEGVAANSDDVTEIEWGLAKNLSDVPPVKGHVTMTGGRIVPINPPEAGLISVTVQPTDRTGVTPGNWFHQCRATFADGTIVDQFSGTVTVAESIFI